MVVLIMGRNSESCSGPSFYAGLMRLALFACVIGCGNSPHGATDAPILDANADGDNPSSLFRAKVDLAAPGNPTFVVLADVNGDGRLDVLTANTNIATLSLFMNATATDATTPEFGNATAITVGRSPACVAVADFNGDGTLDLVTANVAASSASVLFGIGGGAFMPHTDFTTGGSPEFVVVADFDGDGKDDIATANDLDNTVSVLRNTTVALAVTPTFATKLDLATGTVPISLAAADLNGDGKPDLAAGNLTANSISVLLDTTTTMGTPTFATHVDVATGMGPSALVLADVNGDGKPDLAVTDASDNAIAILLDTTPANATTPTFAAKVDVPTGAGPDGLAIGDLDGDGKMDLVTADFGAGSAGVLLAIGMTFAPHLDFASGPRPRAVAIGDLNGDGKPDLVVANGETNTVSIFLAR